VEDQEPTARLEGGGPLFDFSTPQLLDHKIAGTKPECI